MRHSTCRRALLDGELVPEVAEHLDACDECAAFARDLGQVGDYARELSAPPPPDGLADRVIAHVRSAPATPTRSDDNDDADVLDITDPGTRSRRRNPLLEGARRGPLLASVSVAAVMLLLVGVLATLPGRNGDTGGDPLLAAATGTLEAGSARVRLSGTAAVTVQLPENAVEIPEVDVFDEVPAFEPPAFEPPPPPDFDDVPEELRSEFEAEYERQIQSLQEQHERFLEEQGAQLDRLRSDAASAFTILAVPDAFSVEMDITGEGSVAFPDQMEIDGAITVTDAEPELPSGTFEGAFGVVVTPEGTFVRGPDGRWFEVSDSTGPLGPVLADADGVGALLRGAQGDATDLGEETIDGVRVHHLRFALAGTVIAPPDAEASATVDAWVGVDDDVVRKLEVSASTRHTGPDGFEIDMNTRTTLELFDFGADLTIDAPPVSGQSSSPFGPAAVLDPYDAEFGPSFHYGLSTPPPIPDPPALPDFEGPDFEGFEAPEFEFPEFEDPDFEEFEEPEDTSASRGPAPPDGRT